MKIFKPQQVAPVPVQLEDDNRAPMPSAEHQVALALGQVNIWRNRAVNAELMVGQLATVACSLIKMLQEGREITVLGDMVVIPNEVSDRVEGAQVEAVTTEGGDVGVILRERATSPIVTARG